MLTESLWEGVEGVLLDAVGTLIEPDPPVADVYRSAALAQGVDVAATEVKARFHQHFRNDEVDEALGPLRTSEEVEARRWRRIVASVLPEVPDPERAFLELWGHFGRPSAWRCFPDVRPAVNALLTHGIGVRIASNFDGRLRAVVAGLPELSGLAEALVISSEVGLRKPHPEFYLSACESLLLPPSRVLSVGDDPENDVYGPCRAGLRGLLIDRDGRRPEGVASLPGLDALIAWITA
jgi:putative hydrolase of the HAD superfamily